MRVLVPYDARDPKTRLSPLFSPAERRSFARTSLEWVLSRVEEAGHDPLILATDDVEAPWPTVVDDRPLSTAVNARLGDADPPVAVVMADLALASVAALERLFAASGDVVLAPGLGGGTNALLSRTPAFRVDYHGASISDHATAARELGIEPTMLDSFRLAVDVDGPSDLVEVVLHGEGAPAAWVRDAGISVTVVDGEPTVTRPGEEP